MSKENHAYLTFDAKSVNESFARMVVMAFMTDMNPTLDELEDVKTAVSEAVTNAIIHGYGEDTDIAEDIEDNTVNMLHIKEGRDVTEQRESDIVQDIEVKRKENEKKANKQIELSCIRNGQNLWISVTDYGIGMKDVQVARQPFFTTKPNQERSGMGFLFMETFMDEVEVYSKIGEGTCVVMKKYIGKEKSEEVREP